MQICRHYFWSFAEQSRHSANGSCYLIMNANPSIWDEWLAAEDSVSVLAPKTFDHEAALLRLKELRPQIVAGLEGYEVQAGSPELYQDSTGWVHLRVTAKGDSGPFAPALAWIVLSHFGKLVTVTYAQDSELLDRIAQLLENLGLQYVPYDYAANKIYEGQCIGLKGFSWANRYFALCVEFNEQFRPVDYSF